ncbi:MAG: tetratricopeptide repeat protein [Okeania sp. SIO2D1]|nr:tetratricopeptide repeat protein [Okeania sp. SIO2D1]
MFNVLRIKEKAILYYNQALPLYQQLGDRRGEAIIFRSMSYTYGTFGEMEKALFFYQKALPIFQELGDRSREASINYGMGLAYNNVGEYEKALSFYKKALSLYQQLGDNYWEHSTLQVISLAHISLREPEKALNYANQALSIRRQVGDRFWEAVALDIIADIYKRHLGEEEKALSFYNQALSLYQQSVDSHPIGAFHSIAVIKREQDQLDESLTFIEKTLEIIEDRRAQFNNPEFRTSYFARFQNYYQFYIDLLMELHKQNPNQGYDAKAFYASERSRARTFLELLKEAKIDVRQGIDPQLAAAEKNLQQKLASIEKKRLELYNSKPTPEQEATFKSQRDNLNQRLDTLLAEYEIVRTKIRATNPRYAQLTQPQPLSLAEIQSSVLDNNTILLQSGLTQRHYI